MNYQLIAFDMDGTLLDSAKHVLPSSIEAIRRAQDAGKTVVICTGRCPGMLRGNADELSLIRYAICSSGAVVYDLAEKRIMSERSFDPADLRACFEALGDEDAFIEIFSGDDPYYSKGPLEHLDRYGMGIYEPLFRQNCIGVDDIRAFAADDTKKFQKLLFHLSSPEVAARVTERLSSIDVVVAPAEMASLEISPAGVDKGVGLYDLADLLGIDRAATIGVGDSDNDLGMLRAAGLGLAMANARECAREAADVTLELDNDHGGCAEAIDRFLLADAGTSTNAADNQND